MPELRAPEVIQEVDLEQIGYLIDEMTPNEATALKLVRTTFGAYESKRATHERRWDVAARLYHGVVEQRMWPGTEVPRASLPVPIVYDQSEAAFPIISDALFGYWPTFFDVSPLPGTTPAEATQVRDVLAAFLETPFDDSGLTAITHMKMATRQAIKYGDGVIELSYDMALKRPIVEWCDLRDVYFDPASSGPVADWSPAVIRRSLMTVEDLTALRGVDGIKIPSDAILNYLAKARYITSGDTAKQREAAARNEVYYAGDLATDPRHQQVEVLKYWTKDKLIWTLGRAIIAINEKNPYGFIPYSRASYTVIEGRNYSMGVADVLEGDQKYAQGIRNARIDNLSLALNPPRTRAQGSPGTPSKRAWRPGLEDEVSDVKQVETAKIENITQDAYQEEQIIHQGASKRLGINDFAQSGVPAPSNANRTATGFSGQKQAISTRLSTQVSNIEEFMIVPMLYKIKKMIEKFAPEQLEVQNKQGVVSTVPKSVFQKGMHFKMEAASRMITKDRMAMFLQPVSGLLFNEAVIAAANKQNKTLNFEEWQRFFQDATGTSRAYEFFKVMSPEEKQATQQPDPKTMAEMQMKQMDMQVRTQLMDKKVAGGLEEAKLVHDASTTQTAEASAAQLIKILEGERTKRWTVKNEPRPKST